MQFYRLLSSLFMVALIMITLIVQAAETDIKEIVEENKKNAQKGKGGIAFVVCIIIFVGGLIPNFPAIVNEVYEVHKGIIIECEKREYGRTMEDFNCYIVKYVDSDTQEIEELDSLISKHAREGDRIEIREYITYALPVKINGMETDYEKEGPYVWGNIAIDRSIWTVIVLVMVFIHFVQYVRNKKIRCMTRKGVLFWKLWHCGVNMFYLLLAACIWVSAPSLMISYIIGCILWVLFSLGEVSRCLYLLEKRGYVWANEHKKVKKEAIIEKKRTKMKLEEEQIQKVYFQVLSYTRLKQYCEYRYNKKKKERNEMLLVLEVVWSSAFVVLIAVASQVKWLIVGVFGISILMTPVILFRRFSKKNGWLTSAADMGGEYAVAVFEIHERRNFIFEDGRKEICKMKFDDEAKAKDGTQVVLIRLNVTGEIFTETMKTWDAITLAEIHGL